MNEKITELFSSATIVIHDIAGKEISFPDKLTMGQTFQIFSILKELKEHLPLDALLTTVKEGEEDKIIQMGIDIILSAGTPEVQDGIAKIASIVTGKDAEYLKDHCEFEEVLGGLIPFLYHRVVAARDRLKTRIEQAKKIGT